MDETLLKPGQLIDCLLPPALGDNLAIRGRRPCILVGQDPKLGHLVIPLTTGVAGVRNAYAPLIRDNGLFSRARIDNMRWVDTSSILGPSPLGPLRRSTLQGVFEAARENLVALGQRELYRAAKRSI